MEIIIVVSVLTFFIGVLCGCISTSGGQNELDTFEKMRLERRVEDERDRSRSMEQELEFIKRSCRNHHQPPFLGCNGCHQEYRVYAREVDSIKLLDVIKKGKEDAKQLVKDLSL